MPRVNKLTEAERREEKIRKVLKRGLAEKEWSQKHLGELCGMTQDAISRIINQPMSRRFGDVLKVANKLGIDSLPT